MQILDPTGDVRGSSRRATCQVQQVKLKFANRMAVRQESHLLTARRQLRRSIVSWAKCEHSCISRTQVCETHARDGVSNQTLDKAACKSRGGPVGGDLSRIGDQAAPRPSQPAQQRLGLCVGRRLKLRGWMGEHVLR